MIAPHIASWALSKRNNKEGVAAVVATRVDNINDKPKKARVKKERVLETKGGGGYVPPPQPSPQELAQARDWEAQQEFTREQRRSDALKEQQRIEKEASDAAWNSSKGAAYTGALTGGTNRLRGLGIEAGDPYGVYSDFTNRLNTANASLTPGSDYSSAFAPTILDEILGGARSSQRNKYRTAFESQIDPYYAEDRFGSSADDAILNAILEDQYGTAAADLQAARDRGQASNIVYDRALKDLGTARATANTELQNIGGGVLSDITGDIGQRRQSALDSAAEWDFGTTYDPGREAGRIRSYADERAAGLEGALRGAVGGREFFDVNSLLGKATARAGNQTTPAATGSPLFDTFQNEATKANENVRTNEGIF
jgi:hypothetical protein